MWSLLEDAFYKPMGVAMVEGLKEMMLTLNIM
jgi:hypothetical protein